MIIHLITLDLSGPCSVIASRSFIIYLTHQLPTSYCANPCLFSLTCYLLPGHWLFVASTVHCSHTFYMDGFSNFISVTNNPNNSTHRTAWPMYIPSYMPRPQVQQVSMQAEFEELARQRQDLEARELEVPRISRTLNLSAIRDARVTAAASGTGSRHSCHKEQAPLKPTHASSQVAAPRTLTPSGAPPQGSRSLILVPLRL